MRKLLAKIIQAMFKAGWFTITLETYADPVVCTIRVECFGHLIVVSEKGEKVMFPKD